MNIMTMILMSRAICMMNIIIKEALIKYGAEIAKSDFQVNWTKIPQEYCRISRDLSSI